MGMTVLKANWPEAAARSPTENNKESPGNKGMTTKPVSTKTMANKSA